MPALPNGKWERFCLEISRGETAARAYVLAGYRANAPAASRLQRKPEVVQRLNEIYERKINVEAAATQLAIQRLALSKEGLAREFLPLAVSNMRNYVRLESADGLPQFDFRDVTEDQWKAVRAMQIETKGEEVTKVKFWLHPKIEAGMAIAKLFGWIIEKREDMSRLEERLRAMTPEQRAADADELHRKVRQMLLEDQRAREAEAEGGIGEVTDEPEDEPPA